MRIRFWGTRGSIPVAMDGSIVREKIKKAITLANGKNFKNEDQINAFIDESIEFPIRHGFGGESACVQIEGGKDHMICDMGSGLRRFGQHISKDSEKKQTGVYHFFMSHAHWEHIMGFPFFPPAFLPDNTIYIYCGHKKDIIEDAFRRQLSSPYFPVYWDELEADIVFFQLEPERYYDINGFRVKIMPQVHHGDSFGYRFEKKGKTVIYSTDAEHKLKNEKDTETIVKFFQDGDLVIFDAMYSLADMITTKEDWGHSSNIVGVDLCMRANVKQYCMFHHEPSMSDETLYDILKETKRYEEIVRTEQTLKIFTAYDDLIIDL